MDWELLQPYALSLGLGLLVGFQREWASPQVAGIRTFALVSLLGTASGQLAEQISAWMLPAGLLVVAAMVTLRIVLQNEQDEDRVRGLTTHAAALLMYVIGAQLVILPPELPIILSGVVAVLLHWKQPLHQFVNRLGPQDVGAIIQLVLLAVVILPLLPNEDFGPFGVLNPFKIWMLVVLICGISLAGYIGWRFLGERAGVLLGGIFGGLISSTATTVSYSRRSKSSEVSPNAIALVLMIASVVVFCRVFVEVAVVTPGIVMAIMPPLATQTGIMAAIAIGLYLRTPHLDQRPPENEDPSELKAALVFGALYALVLMAVAWTKEHLGDQGLYFVAAISGLTDMDAITLTAARFVANEQITLDMGWRMILTGALSNLVFKLGVVAVLGNRQLLARVAIVFSVSIVSGLALLLLWPTIE